MIHRSIVLLVALAGLGAPRRIVGQERTNVRASSYDDGLVPRVRAAAAMIPGARPLAVHVYRFGDVRLPESYYLENGADRPIAGTYSIFQIRYPDGRIVVDAGMDPEVAGDTTARYRGEDAKVRAALRDARMIVMTHEHHDHVGGVVRSPDLAALVPKTVLNRAQVATLRERPNVPQIRLDSAAAARYVVVDYDLIAPIAPGVVLIRAAGHTAGSQMIYVRLASGREVLLIGDIVWNMAGLEEHRQKPEATSREIGEDRALIAAEIDWLHGLTERTGIEVANSHDDAWLRKLVARRVLVDGLAR